MNSTLFETLADPTRRLIVEELSEGERSVGELVEAVTIRQSGVSRHLRILHEAGFVTVRPDGQRRLYSLAPEPFRELEDWVSRYRAVWESRLERLGSELDRRKSDNEHKETR